LRTSEGYGHIEVNSHGFSNITKEALRKDENLAFNLLLNYEELKELLEFCLVESLKSAIGIYVINAIDSPKYTSMSISGSFLQRLLIFIKTSNTIDDFNKKLANLKKTALNQLTKIEKDLFIDNQKVNEKAFNERLETLSKKQIDFTTLNQEGIGDSEFVNYYSNKFTELYFIFCSLFVTSIILKTREVK